CRENSSVVVDDFACGLVQHTCTPVIPEAAPGSENGVETRPGKRLHVGKPLQKSSVVLDHCRDTRLLQNDFRDPDAVGIAVFPPGQVTLVGVIPCKQATAQESALPRILQ